MDRHLSREVDYIVLCKQCHEKFHDDVPSVIDTIQEAFIKQKKERDEYFKKKEYIHLVQATAPIYLRKPSKEAVRLSK